MAGRKRIWASGVSVGAVRGEGRRRRLVRGLGFDCGFAEGVDGPLMLGYGAHFGLGLFEAVDVAG